MNQFYKEIVMKYVNSKTRMTTTQLIELLTVNENPECNKIIQYSNTEGDTWQTFYGYSARLCDVFNHSDCIWRIIPKQDSPELTQLLNALSSGKRIVYSCDGGGDDDSWNEFKGDAEYLRQLYDHADSFVVL